MSYALHWLDPWSYSGRCPLAGLHVLLFCQEDLNAMWIPSSIRNRCQGPDLVGLDPGSDPRNDCG